MTKTRIKVWYCETCGYWRQEESTGIHMVASTTGNPFGPMVSHTLVEREFVSREGYELVLAALRHLATPNHGIAPTAQDAVDMVGYARGVLSEIEGGEGE